MLKHCDGDKWFRNSSASDMNQSVRQELTTTKVAAYCRSCLFGVFAIRDRICGNEVFL